MERDRNYIYRVPSNLKALTVGTASRNADTQKPVFNCISLDEWCFHRALCFRGIFKLEDTKRNSEKLIDTLKAVLEETDIRIADLKKEAYEFKRDIVVGAENMRTGNTMAEKVKR